MLLSPFTSVDTDLICCFDQFLILLRQVLYLIQECEHFPICLLFCLTHLFVSDFDMIGISLKLIKLLGNLLDFFILECECLLTLLLSL